jgi:alanine dehydrogenase
MKTLILGHEDIRALVDMELAVHAVERGFRAYALGEARMPPKVYLDLPEHEGDFRAMPALMGQYAGVKWVNAHPHNRSRHHLPTVMGTYVLSDPRSGFPLAVMDGTLLTAFRTGAASAVATKYLAASDPIRIGFIGCGVQARMFRDAHRVLYQFEVLVADRDQAAAERFAAESHGRVVSIAEAAQCPVVCIATPSYVPVIQQADVLPGTHINAMGADGPGKQELDPGLIGVARIIVDEAEQALHGGEVNVPFSQGIFRESDIAATLGDVIVGRAQGRLTPQDITIFDSTGLAIQDVALASALYERAVQQGAGQRISLVPGL